MLGYWRNSLADSARMNINSEKLKQAEKISFEQIKLGYISKEKAEIIVEKYLEENKKNVDNSEPFAEVLVCPTFLSPAREYTQKNKNESYLTPIWMTAKLFQTGELLPADEPYIWIPRDLLEPTESDKSQIIGEVFDVDYFLEQNPYPVNLEDAEMPLRWKDVWNYANEMLLQVTGLSIESFYLEDYAKNNNAFVLLEENIESDKIRLNIIKLYDYLRKNNLAPKLLSRFSSLQDNILKPLLSETQKLEKSALHYGQMKGGFSLSTSQREALHHFLTIEEGEILAINGPPGTGKTTLLQSVVATMWVEAALKGNRQPPIIVATSTNNQAVTNVIGDFAIKSEENSILGKRWISEIESFGLYCPSETKISDSVNFQITFADKTYPENGLYLPVKSQNERINIEDEEFVFKAKKDFLKQCAIYANENFENVEKATQFLQKELIKITNTIGEGLSAWQKQNQLSKFVKENYGSLEELNKSIETLEEKIKETRKQLGKIEEDKNDWIDFDNSIPFWLKILSFLPFVKKQISFRYQAFFSKQNSQIDSNLSNEEILNLFENNLRKLADEGEYLLNESDKLQQLKESSDSANQTWKIWKLKNEIEVEPPQLLDKLDETLRYQAFQIATHYWEGCWLLENLEEISQNYKEKKSVEKQQKRWRRYAKITPCFVATFHSLPKFFKAWEGEEKPLLEFIDLLIVDEAGQVSPEVAGASFALAKKALVVGDVLQIEPVWSLNKQIDAGNLKRHKLIEKFEEADSINDLGVTATKGNVMRIAQRASKYQKFDDFERGMFLAEHRRCVPEIINYCNELAYKGRLVPKRDSVKNYPLPHIGYAHIKAQSRKINGSRENQIEAEILARWIAENKTFLKDVYLEKKLSLSEIVGIVTPFRRQARLISEKLKEFGVTEKLTVGSVHSLQGAERPIVIFSAVHGTDDKSYFFDGKPNMLNVAVSRAKDSFLVFGNVGIFNASAAKRPARLLAKYLFADAKNEITNIYTIVREEFRISENIYHLTNLESHRQALRDGFLQATRQLVIVSPFITDNAVNADNLPELINNAIERGIEIKIYTDPQLNLLNGKLRPSFIKGKEILIKSGATIKEVQREHSKTLIIDRTTLIEGSFNWLSASRDENSQYQRNERSIKYSGNKISSEIEKTIAETESRVISK